MKEVMSRRMMMRWSALLGLSLLGIEQVFGQEREAEYGWQYFGRVKPLALQTYTLPSETSLAYPLYDLFDQVSAVYPQQSLVRYDLVPDAPGWGVILGERSAYQPERGWAHVQPDTVSFVLGSYFRLADIEPWTEDGELTVLTSTTPGAKRIEIDLTRFHLSLFEQDARGEESLVLRTLIAANPDLTPVGEFPITAKQFVDTMIGTSRASELGYNHYSVGMSMQFTGSGEKIHDSGFMEWTRFPESWQRGNIRRYARSNGCIRVPMWSAEEFLAWHHQIDSRDGEVGENAGEQADYLLAHPEFLARYGNISLAEFVFRWSRPHVSIHEHFEGLRLQYGDQDDEHILQDPAQATRVRITR